MSCRLAFPLLRLLVPAMGSPRPLRIFELLFVNTIAIAVWTAVITADMVAAIITIITKLPVGLCEASNRHEAPADPGWASPIGHEPSEDHSQGVSS